MVNPCPAELFVIFHSFETSLGTAISSLKLRKYLYLEKNSHHQN